MYVGKGAFLKNFLLERYGKRSVNEYEIKHAPLTMLSETVSESHTTDDSYQLMMQSDEFQFDDIAKSG